MGICQFNQIKFDEPNESESENERQSGVHVITESKSCVNVILPESESDQKVKVARQWKWCKC